MQQNEKSNIILRRRTTTYLDDEQYNANDKTITYKRKQLKNSIYLKITDLEKMGKKNYRGDFRQKNM
jgi:hypothetical protein